MAFLKMLFEDFDFGVGFAADVLVAGLGRRSFSRIFRDFKVGIFQICEELLDFIVFIFFTSSKNSSKSSNFSKISPERFSIFIISIFSKISEITSLVVFWLVLEFYDFPNPIKYLYGVSSGGDFGGARKMRTLSF